MCRERFIFSAFHARPYTGNRAYRESTYLSGIIVHSDYDNCFWYWFEELNKVVKYFKVKYAEKLREIKKICQKSGFLILSWSKDTRVVCNIDYAASASPNSIEK